MPGAKTYLVPIDFSRGSETALNHVLTLVREEKGRIVLLPSCHPHGYGISLRECRPTTMVCWNNRPARV